MSYRIVVGRSAEKALRKRIRPDQAGRVREAIDSLAENPRPPGSRKMQGREGYRLRVGDYRIIYEVEEPEGEARGTVYILNVGHRQGIYD